MKQTTTEVITRLTIEYNDLAGRIGSLERFLICEDFQKVSSSQRVLLAQQRTAMEQYKEILLKRLVDLRNQENQEKAMTCCTPAEEATPEEVKDNPRSCENCKHFIYAAPYDGRCSIAVQCAKGSQWEAK
jgi:hypothetical protein